MTLVSDILDISLEEYTKPERDRLAKKLAGKFSSLCTEIYDLSNSELRETALWRKTRGWRRLKDNNTCQTCSNKGQFLDVHHRDYRKETMEGRRPESLITLCRRCHSKVEWHETEEINKRDCLIQKEYVLARMLESNELRKKEKQEWKKTTNYLHAATKINIEHSTVRGLKNIAISISPPIDESVELNLTYFCFDLYSFIYCNSNNNLRARNLLSGDIALDAARGKPAKIYHAQDNRVAVSLLIPSPNKILVKVSKSCEVDIRNLVEMSVDKFYSTDKFQNIYVRKKH